ncbi:MAG: bifunctional folylpolyglutamate synthase/dihydrofolate synthase [Ruminiclostridium sp.]|nr:bifunctional folylpolyglutamate synthase/dihydrofolate synthase [Ruminiclostridium sp.]
MTYEESLTYIHSISWKGAVLGLSRIQELLTRLGNPEKTMKYVHIAGTNGKGSTAAMLASVLRQAGYRTGLFTSPFISRFNERMQIDGEQIPDQELADITAQVMPHAEAMKDHPTEFELVTAIALVYFAQHKCDVVSLEVGMGGRLDSTNVIDPPEVAVLCNLGLDHTEYLGATIEEIAANKAGIIKAGCQVAAYRSSPNVEAIYTERCREVGAELHFADFDSLALREHSFLGQQFDLGDRKNLLLPLLGEHQLKNAAVVLTAVDCLNRRGWHIGDEAIRTGLRQVVWPGRFEILRRDPDVIVDGGHNPQCLDALVKNIRDYLDGRPITALTGVMADKDYGRMYEAIAPYVARFVTVTPDNHRAMPAEELKAVLAPYGKPVTACDRVADGMKLALEQIEPHGLVLAFGSLYMVGDVREAVLNP